MLYAWSKEQAEVIANRGVGGFDSFVVVYASVGEDELVGQAWENWFSSRSTSKANAV